MEILVPLISFLVFVGVLYAAYKVVRYAHSCLGEHITGTAGRALVRIGLIAAAVVAGIFVVSLSYNFSDTQMFVGVPIPWAVWEFRDGAWQDLIGVVSMFAWVADIVIAAALVHLPVAAGFFVRRRNSRIQ